jgi:hypothetical protein
MRLTAWGAVGRKAVHNMIMAGAYGRTLSLAHLLQKESRTEICPIKYIT